MTNVSIYRHSRQRAGASSFLLTMSLVVVSLAVFGVPRYLHSIEQAKLVVAIDFMRDVHSAQHVYQAQTGCYAKSIDKLDLSRPLPPYFSVGMIESESPGGWSLTLKRAGLGLGVGDYQIVFNENGFDPMRSSVADVMTADVRHPHTLIAKNLIAMNRGQR